MKKHTGGTGLFIIITFLYLGALILFAVQTYRFVDWLFPQDDFWMKLLTVVCFDVMALLWACLDLFYQFAVKGARTLGRWAWAISFILSLLASVFYMVLNSIFRFKLEITSIQVNIGYGIVIIAVTLQVLFITFWWYLEWNARHPYQDEYVSDIQISVLPDGRGGREPVAMAQTQVIEEPVVTEPVKKKRVRRDAVSPTQK